MSMIRHTWVVGFACLCAALTVGATPAAACDPMWLPVGRTDGTSMFVALALAETVLDTLVAAVGSRVHPLFARRLGAYTGRSRGGQRVRLVEWPDRVTPQTGEAILVPWAYREDCSPIEWTGRLDWIPAGTRGVVTGWLRPREHWLEGLPTFDVEMAWREPQWTADERRWAGGSGEGALMTPEEFLQLYAAMPTFGQLDRAPDDAAALARAWAGAHPSLAARAPAPTLLGHVYRTAEARSLAGCWLVEVELLDARELPLPSRTRAIKGEVRLSPVASAPAVEDTAPVSHYVGSSTLEFSGLGFRLRSSEVIATVASDGIRLLFDPTVDHGHVVATVSRAEDELVGTWYLNSRPARASGSIRLKRAGPAADQ
jgi:hypothetical protein